ncbi:MAG: biotin/lipoyl-binding protein [Patescibacteria group bacterium]|jgi:multidrug resistance efflux pump
MEGKSFKGIVKCRVIEVRFGTSGKVASVAKKIGDSVKKGELLASLDRKSFQMELDRQLTDYERVRAEFEIFNLEKGEPKDDVARFLKTQKQSQLNASVKDVELAKVKMDMADLFSPIEGLIVDDSNIVAGIYVTPSSNPFKIAENKFFLEMEADQDEVALFLEPQKLTLKIPGLDKVIETTSLLPVLPGSKGKFLIKANLEDSLGFISGLVAEAVIGDK